MTPARTGAPGATRTCPHCKATILESATVCPACRKYLRFVAGAPQREPAAHSPLTIEGTIRHPADGEPWEYCVVVTVRDDRSKDLARHVVGVGVLRPGEGRSFRVAVEVYAPRPGTTTTSR